MEEFIGSLSEKLNIAPATAREAVKVLLQFAHKQVTGTEFAELINRIPGAAELIAETPTASDAPNSLGGLFGSLGGLMGGQAGDAAKALSALQAAGLNMAQIGPFVRTFVEKSKEVAGPETVDAVISKIPVLQTFLKS
ncbi:hypothetical protein BH09VER1_BH09VER1_23260 [soil metagenome]